MWLGVSNGRPTVLGELLSIRWRGKVHALTFANHDSLLKAALYVFTWIIVAFLQVLYWISLFIWVSLSLVYLIPLAAFGVYLFQCKVISVGTVW